MDKQKTKPNRTFNKDSKSDKDKKSFSGDRRGRPSFERPKPEFDQKIVSIRRVTRVVAGGRRMTFAVAMAIGDKKGSIGLGTGKGGDTAVAIEKALRQAKRSMFKIKTTKDMSIPHEISSKFSSSKLVIMPNRGKGLVAGSTIRDMLLLGGFKNVTAKLHSGSKNKLNNARVTYKAFLQLKSNETALIKEKVLQQDEKTDENIEEKIDEKTDEIKNDNSINNEK